MRLEFLQVLLQKLRHFFEFSRVGGIDFDQGFVRFDAGARDFLAPTTGTGIIASFG